MSESLEDISASVLLAIIKEGKAAEFITRNGKLARACRALLSAVDFTAEQGNYDVRPRDPVNAAKALAEIAEAFG